MSKSIGSFFEIELNKLLKSLNDDRLLLQLKRDEESLNKKIEIQKKTAEMKRLQEERRISQIHSVNINNIEGLIAEFANTVELYNNNGISIDKIKKTKKALELLIKKINLEKDSEINELKNKINKQIEDAINIDSTKYNNLLRKNISELNNIIKATYDKLEVINDFYETAPFDSEIWKTIKFRSAFPEVKHILFNEKKQNYSFQDSKIEFNVPEIKSFFTTNSFSLIYNKEHRFNAKLVIDQIITRCLMAAEPGNMHFYFIDAYGNGNIFLDYLDLPKEIINKKIITSTDEIEKVLFDISNLEKIIIQDNIKSMNILDFNKKYPKAAIPLRVIIFDSFPINITPNIAHQIERLLRTAITVGVQFIFLIEKNQITGVEDLINKTEKINIDSNIVDYGTEFNEIKKSVIDICNLQFNTENNILFEEYYTKEKKWWKYDSKKELSIPIGMNGANEFTLNIGIGKEAHATIAGQTGSGKTKLLHNLITSASINYSPDELRFFLIDLKEGTEFKRYLEHKLPHVDFLALHASPEFGIHILNLVVKKYLDRADLFRENGVSNLEEFRNKRPDVVMPRYLIVIDEYQEMLRDRSLRTIAYDKIELIVRKGRAAGFNLFLSSQSVNISNDIMSEIGQRIAMKCDPSIGRQVMGTAIEDVHNLKAGQAIIGYFENNTKVQSFFLRDKPHFDILDKIYQAWVKKMNNNYEYEAIVFERESKALLNNNKTIKELQKEIENNSITFSPGEKLMVDGDDFMCNITKEYANNLFVTGGKFNVSTRALAGSFVSMLPFLNTSDTEIHIFNNINKSQKESYSAIKTNSDYISNNFKNSSYQEAEDDITNLLENILTELSKRQDKQNTEVYYPPIILVFFNIENYSGLKKTIEQNEYTENISAIPEKPELSQIITMILEKGPEVGIHCLIHSASPKGYYSVFDDNDIDLFNHRILLQMSEDESMYFLGRYRKDAANLFDIGAGKEGHNRAIYYDNYSQNHLDIIKPYEFLSLEELKNII